jgi:hypothetical protein
MVMSKQDSRILVRVGDPGDSGVFALLIEDGAPAIAVPPGQSVVRFAVPATRHALGCACCPPRGPVAQALGRLFLARARGEAALFDTVVAVTHTPAGEAAVRAALDQDVVTRARFRLAPDQSRG